MIGYDYGFGIYNPGIARFLSVDPLATEYPWYTPYQFAGNTPVQAIDIDGLEDYYIVHYTRNTELVGLKIMVENPDAQEVTYTRFLRPSSTFGGNPFNPRPELEIPRRPGKDQGYMPPPKDKQFEISYLRILRQTGTLYALITGDGVTYAQTTFPIPFLFPDQAVEPLQIDPIPPLGTTLDLNLKPITFDDDGHELYEDVALDIEYNRRETIPSNESSARRAIREVVSTLAANPTLTVEIEANIGSGMPEYDMDLASERKDRVLVELMKEAKRQGVDISRISGTVGNRAERSVRAKYFKSEDEK